MGQRLHRRRRPLPPRAGPGDAPQRRRPSGGRRRPRTSSTSAPSSRARESREDLESSLALIAAELNAEKIGLSVLHRATGTIVTLVENGLEKLDESYALADYPLTASVFEDQASAQVLVGDPAADPSETELLLSLGYHSLLMVPVVHRGESIGLIEAFRNEEQPWTRAEINRARIISNQFASVIDMVFVQRERPLDGRPMRR